MKSMHLSVTLLVITVVFSSGLGGCCSAETENELLKTLVKKVNSQTFPGSHSKRQRKYFRRYVGEWRGDGLVLKIESDGWVEAEEKSKWGQTVTRAKIQTFEHKKSLRIGALGRVTDKFVIDQPPHENGVDWTMTINGIELVRE